MSMYISFATKDNDDSVFFTTNARRGIFEDITDQIGPISMEDMGRFLTLTTKQLSFIANDLNKTINNTRQRIALTLFKRDYDVFELQSDMEYYDNLLTDLGQLNTIIDIAYDNDGVLYVNIG